MNNTASYGEFVIHQTCQTLDDCCYGVTVVSINPTRINDHISIAKISTILDMLISSTSQKDMAERGKVSYFQHGRVTDLFPICQNTQVGLL